MPPKTKTPVSRIRVEQTVSNQFSRAIGFIEGISKEDLEPSQVAELEAIKLRIESAREDLARLVYEVESGQISAKTDHAPSEPVSE